MEWINRMRKDKKGFTLVEIIVVLVILAILAAFTIPTMLGFVSDARGKAMIAEAREVYVAAQSTATEISAKDTVTSTDLGSALSSLAVLNEKTTPTAVASATAYTKASSQMVTYVTKDINIAAGTTAEEQRAAAIASKTDSCWTVTMDTTNTAKVSTVVYVKNGYQITITGNDTTVQKVTT